MWGHGRGLCLLGLSVVLMAFMNGSPRLSADRHDVMIDAYWLWRKYAFKTQKPNRAAKTSCPVSLAQVDPETGTTFDTQDIVLEANVF